MLTYAYLLVSTFQMPFTLPTAKRNECLPETQVSVVTPLRLMGALTARKGSEVRLQAVLLLRFCTELKHGRPHLCLLANWQKLFRRED